MYFTSSPVVLSRLPTKISPPYSRDLQRQHSLDADVYRFCGVPRCRRIRRRSCVRLPLALALTLSTERAGGAEHLRS